MIPIWFVWAFTAALSWATADLLSKKLMNVGDMDEYITLWSRFIFSLPFLLIPLVVRGIPEVSPDFWWITFLWLPGDTLASILYIKAVKISPLSLVVPLLSTAPVFMLLTSSVILREFPSLLGITGVVMVSVGAYTLNWHKTVEDAFAPLKALFKERGARFTIIAAFLYSLDTAFGKMALRASNPEFFSFYYSLIMSLAFAPIVVKKSSTGPGAMLKDWRFFSLGFLFAAGIYFFLMAIGMANIAYVSGVGRLSMIIAVLYGRFFFQEVHLRERLMGSLIILAGVFLILFGG